MEALGIPTEELPGAPQTPAKPNTQNRGAAPMPNGGNNGGDAETPGGN